MSHSDQGTHCKEGSCPEAETNVASSPRKLNLPTKPQSMHLYKSTFAQGIPYQPT